MELEGIRISHFSKQGDYLLAGLCFLLAQACIRYTMLKANLHEKLCHPSPSRLFTFTLKVLILNKIVFGSIRVIILLICNTDPSALRHNFMNIDEPAGTPL